MDPIVVAAGNAVVSAMATDAWEQARNAVVAWWHRVHPATAEGVSTELAEVHTEVLEARRAGDGQAEQALVGVWQSQLQRLLRTDPALLDQIRVLVEQQLLPLLEASERDRVHSIVQNVTASGNAVVNQAGRDLTIHPAPQPPAS